MATRPGHTESSVVIDAPIDLVWDMTNDVASWPGLFTEYAAADVLEQNENTVRFRLTMHPDPQGNKWSWVSERIVDPVARTVVARRIEKGWFEDMDIRWTYHEVAGGVRMDWVQDFRMRPDSPVSLDQMTQRISTNSPIQMAAIKEKIEKAAVG